MESRFKPAELASSQGGVKKKYMDKKFKKAIVKALKANNAEPDNIEKIRGHKHIGDFTSERIAEFVNCVSSDVQKKIEQSIEDPEAQQVFRLAQLMSQITDNEKPQELPLALKARAEGKNQPELMRTNGVQFAELTKFLYSAALGKPDCSDLNPESFKVLHDTHLMMMQQVEHDATPEFIEELKSKICAGYTEEPHPKIAQLAGIFQDKSLNPLSFPFEYLLNGTLPVEEANNAVEIQIQVIPSNDSSESPKKKTRSNVADLSSR